MYFPTSQNLEIRNPKKSVRNLDRVLIRMKTYPHPLGRGALFLAIVSMDRFLLLVVLFSHIFVGGPAGSPLLLSNVGGQIGNVPTIFTFWVAAR